MNPWLVLGRDGVITEEFIPGQTTVAGCQPLPGSIDALARLTRAGFKVVLAFNQSAIGRGLVSEQQVQAWHRCLHDEVQAAGGRIEGVYYCPHHTDEQCDCRKPRTGLLQRIERSHAISLADCWAVGDSLKDIQAAKAHGMKPALVRTGKGSQTETAILVWPKYNTTQVFDDLAAFADHLLKE